MVKKEHDLVIDEYNPLPTSSILVEIAGGFFSAPVSDLLNMMYTLSYVLLLAVISIVKSNLK